jgi:hypothetical protein
MVFVCHLMARIPTAARRRCPSESAACPVSLASFNDKNAETEGWPANFAFGLAYDLELDTAVALPMECARADPGCLRALPLRPFGVADTWPPLGPNVRFSAGRNLVKLVSAEAKDFCTAGRLRSTFQRSFNLTKAGRAAVAAATYLTETVIVPTMT